MSPILQRVWSSIETEFSDIREIEQFTQMAIRLSMAAILGGLIGYEREAKGKSAGLRTHILVGLGSAMFIVIPLQAGVLMTDISRVFQGLMAGIGFLGAGAIVHGDKGNRGLTTAASIWLTAAIGASAGMGRESSAVLGTILTVFVLTLVKKASARNVPIAEPIRSTKTNTENEEQKISLVS